MGTAAVRNALDGSNIKRVTLFAPDGTTASGVNPTAAAAADALANPTISQIGADLMGFNGTTWDRLRSSVEATLLASASRTTTQTSADIPVYNLKYLSVVLDMTTVGTGSVTLTINRKDVASGKYVLLLSGAAVTTNVTNTYNVGPTLVAAANAVATASLGTIIQIVVTANNANAATYSVGYALNG